MDKEILKLMEEITEEITKDMGNNKDIKKDIKKELKKITEEFDDNEIIFVSRSKCYLRGTRIAIEALLYSLIKQLKEENSIDIEELTKIFIQAVAMDNNFKKVDKDVVSKILKQIDKMI